MANRPRVDDSLIERNMNFWVSSDVADNEVHLALATKEPATPANTLSLNNFITTIPENLSRIDTWQKFPVKEQEFVPLGEEGNRIEIALQTAGYYGLTGTANATNPFCGYRRLSYRPLGGGPIQYSNLYISSEFYYITQNDINVTTLRVRLNTDGEMGDGYFNAQPSNYSYFINLWITIEVVLPGASTAQSYQVNWTLNPQLPGSATHDGVYIIPIGWAHHLGYIPMPSGSTIVVRVNTLNTGPGGGGYVVFIDSETSATSSSVSSLSNVAYKMIHTFPPGPVQNSEQYLTNYNLRLVPVLPYVAPKKWQLAFQEELLRDWTDPNVVLEGTFVVEASGLVDMTLSENYNPEASGISSYYVDVDDNGRSLPISPSGITSPNLDVTDITINKFNPTLPDIPLTWSYTLKYDNKAYDDASSISIYDNQRSLIPTDLYYTERGVPRQQTGIGNVFSTQIYLPSQLIRTPGVTLTAKYNKVLDGKMQSNYTEIINPDKPYVNFDYILDRTWNPVRLRTLNAGKLRGVNPDDPLKSHIWVKPADEAMIAADYPIGDENSAWYPRVRAGLFEMKNQSVTIYDDGAYSTIVRDVVYHTPEVGLLPSQPNWATDAATPAASGIADVIKIIKEVPEIVSSTHIKTRSRPIYFWDGDKDRDNAGGWDNNIEGWPTYTPPNLQDWHTRGGSFDTADVNTSAKYSHGITIYKNNQLLSNSDIRDWDYFNGSIHLKTPLRPDDLVEVTYLAEKVWIPATGLDLNPNQGNDYANKVGKTFRIVLKPDWLGYPTDTKDPGPASDADNADEHKLAWHYLESNPNNVYNATWDGAGTLLAGSSTGFDWLTGDEVGLPKGTLIVADITISQHKERALKLLDARVRGGGIKDDEWFSNQDWLKSQLKARNLQARELRQKESRFYMDIGHWDGEPYQGDGVLCIRIPLAKRTEIYNNFIESNIGATEISKDDRALVDNYYDTNGNYNFAGITSGITSTDRLNSIREYIDLLYKSYYDADNLIRGSIEKYLAYGTYYVLLDEDVNLWPNAQKIDIQNTPR